MGENLTLTTFLKSSKIEKFQNPNLMEIEEEENYCALEGESDNTFDGYRKRAHTMSTVMSRIESPTCCKKN